MNKENNILQSLNGLQKAKAPDYFHTHLLGKMQQQSSIKEPSYFILRPTFNTTLLCLLFTINVFSLVKFNTTKLSKSIPQAKQSTFSDAFADAYNMNTEFIYE